MPFGSRATKLDRLLAGPLAWNQSEARDPNDEIRVPVTAIAGPSAAELAAVGALDVAGQIATGYPGTTHWHPPPRPHVQTGRTIVLDAVGIRHADVPQGVARLSSVHLNFAVRWIELSRIVMELIVNPRINMTQTRVVLVPQNPGGFGAAHPEMAPMNGAARVGPGAWMLSLGMSYSPDPHVVAEMLSGLGRYAGPRFSGRIDNFTA